MRFRRYAHCFPPRHVYCCSIKKHHSKQLTDLHTVIIHYNRNRFLFRIRRYYSITQCVLRYSLVLDVLLVQVIAVYFNNSPLEYFLNVRKHHGAILYGITVYHQMMRFRYLLNVAPYLFQTQFGTTC